MQQSQLERLGQVFDPKYDLAWENVCFAAHLKKRQASRPPDYDKLYRRKAELDGRFFGDNMPESA